MGFFDFVKSKNSKKYTDEIVDEEYEEDLYGGQLPNYAQSVMYTWARNVQMASNAAMKNPNKSNIEHMKETIGKYMEGAKAVEGILTHNGIYEIKAEHLGAAFYLVNLGDVTFKDATLFSTIEIKNTVATVLVGIGYDNVQPHDIPEVTVRKVKVTVKYLLSHPTN